MVEVWIKKIREFEGLDKNADLVITVDEAPDLFTTPEFDPDKNGNVTINEWMNQKDNSSGMMWHEKAAIQSLFKDDLISGGLARFAEIGITNKYDVLIYLVKMDPTDETSILDLINLRTPVISTLIAMGFSQEDALQATEQIDKTGFSEKLIHFSEMLEKFGITTLAAKNAIISNLLEKRHYYILDDIDKLYKSLERLGCSANETQEIFTYYYERGFVWSEWIDAISIDDSCNTIFSVILPNELKALVLDAARTDNSGILPSLKPEMANAIDALRSYGADEATIRWILIERIPKIRNGAGIIIKNIPDVLNAFSRLNIDKKKGPVHELLSWINNIDPNGQAFWTFNSLPQEVDWLNSIFKDSKELDNIIAHAFLMPFSLISFHKLYDKFLSFGLNSFTGEDLCRFIARVDITTNYVSVCNSLDAINTLEISGDKKRSLLEPLLLNMANPKVLPQMDGIIEGLRKEKITDSDIFDILCATTFSTCEAADSVLLGACDVLKKMGIGVKDPHEMLPYLKRSLELGDIGAILFNIKYVDNALRNMRFSQEGLMKIEDNFPLGEFGPSAFWDFLIFTGNHKVSPEETKDLDYYIDLCNCAKKILGITRYGRYSPKILEAALSGERKEKHAFVPVAKDDWNGAFYGLAHDLELLIRSGYSIDIVEASTEEKIYQTLEKYPPDSIDLLFINGHGQPDQISLSAGMSETTTIDITDSEWKEYLLKMKSGGKVLFASCSTGNGPNSLVYKFEEWGDNERTLEFVAPPSSTGSRLIIGPDGTPDIEYKRDYKPLDPVRLLNQGKPN